jgi:DNA-binding response OmpR family regulator
MRLLLVEDDQALSRAVEQALSGQGYAIDAVGTADAALFLLEQAPQDAVVLDLGLPDGDGIDVLKHIRKHWAALPVLILTARDSIDDRVRGLDAGADDYLTKPFEIPELVARIRAITRRASGRSDNVIAIGNITLNLAAQQVSLAGDLIELSGKEYRVLHTLMEHRGRLMTREQIETSLYAWGDEVGSNTVEVYIHGLRKKLGKDFIKTVRGIGYGVGLR